MPSDAEQLRRMATRHGCESRSSTLSYATLIESILGQPERARRLGREALELSERVGHAQTRACVLMHLALSCQIRHDAREALHWAERALEFSRERDYRMWLVWATLVKGWCQAELGRAREGSGLIREGLEHWTGLGLRGRMPYNLGLFAESLLRLGEVHEGLGAVHEGLGLVESTGERSWEAELHRVKGELLRAGGRMREARPCFIRAMEVAHQQGAVLLELRATVGLGRLLRDLGRTEEARPLLVRACLGFEAVGDCPDDREARALLEVLAGPGGLESRAAS